MTTGSRPSAESGLHRGVVIGPESTSLPVFLCWRPASSFTRMGEGVRRLASYDAPPDGASPPLSSPSGRASTLDHGAMRCPCSRSRFCPSPCPGQTAGPLVVADFRVPGEAARCLPILLWHLLGHPLAVSNLV